MSIRYPSTKEEAVTLIKGFVPDPYAFSRFEENIEKYNGRYRPYLLKFLRHIRAENRGVNRFLGIAQSDIERIVDAIFPKQS